MKAIQLFTVLAGALALLSCSSKPLTYTIKGTMRDSSNNGKIIYLYRNETRKNIDSTIVEGNKFIFTGKTDSSYICQINTGNRVLNFILESGNITVDFAKPKSPSGTPLNEAFSQSYRLMDSLHKVSLAKSKEIAGKYPDQKERKKAWKEFYQNEWKPTFFARQMAILEKHANTDVAAVILENMDFLLTPDQMEAAIAKVDSTIRNRRTLLHLAKRTALKKNTAEGKPFADFTAENVDGTPVSLSHYVGKGKYVLVDFWASWCVPCREEMPNIAEVYKQYKDKGLEVVGVTMWDEKEASRKAIKEEGNTWPQIINAEMKPFDLYGFNSIPFIMLIGPDGTIIARNLRGENLKAKVKEVMENNN